MCTKRTKTQTTRTQKWVKRQTTLHVPWRCARLYVVPHQGVRHLRSCIKAYGLLIYKITVIQIQSRPAQQDSLSFFLSFFLGWRTHNNFFSFLLNHSGPNNLSRTVDHLLVVADLLVVKTSLLWRWRRMSLLSLFLVSLVVVINPENLYLASRPGREPVGGYPPRTLSLAATLDGPTQGTTPPGDTLRANWV